MTNTIVNQQQYAQPVNMVMESIPQYASPVTYAAPQVQYAGTTTLAAPAYTTMAAPMTMAAQAPTYTTMAAPTVTTMAAPLTGTIQNFGGSVSAPIYSPAPINYGTGTMIAAPQVTQAASYVQQPIMQAPMAQQVMTVMQAPSVVPMPQAPQVMLGPAPASLTQGIPNPDQITAQKTQYAEALKKQLKDGMETIQKENEIEKSMVQFTADKQLALMQMQVEEQLNEQIALLDEQATIRQCELKKAWVERKIQLDNQSNGFIMDYKMKAIQTELAQKTYAFQQTYGQAERALELQYNQEVAKSQTATSYSVPAQAVPAAAAK